MGKRENQRGKLNRELVEEEDRVQTPHKSSFLISDDDDEDEANEDLSLKIVEKALLMRAAKLVPDDGVSFPSDGVDFVVNNTPSGVVAGAEVVNNATEEKKKLIKKVKKKTIKKTEIANGNDVETKEEEKPEDIKAVVAEVTEPNPVTVADNIVLRKLLRGPRYFDPPDSSWGTCYNCGEEGHAEVNCKSARRKKPCFVCGSFEHNAKQCNKGQDCFICRKRGHRARDCPDKHKGSSMRSNICLKCGYSGHDMFSCRNDYEHDDLKEICCYVCKNMGHLCCVKYADSCQNVVSCYKCGQVGHTGLSCTRMYGETTGGTDVVASSCFRCGEGGHFARECTSSYKVGKRDREPSTPTLRVHREHKHKKEFKSAPHDLGKANKKKKSHHHEPSGVTTPRKSKHRGGWIVDDPGDFSYDNGRNKSWRSPVTPTGNHRGRWMREDLGDFSYDNRRKQSWRSPASPYSQGHRISTITAGGHISNSQSSKRTRKGYGNRHFQGSYNAW
ncbi:uncharacterized protein LOC133802652 [Humulus lupulus]|uniref:uncharacterized protein LOC133802652 n=1 Tax=Humulus lupulus TaxID=3486 RepID=UPI002B40E3DE|nr:uncharacterized protein LOC133802652 [Humulus lupulus]